MVTLVALIAVFLGSFVLAALTLPLLLQMALNRFFSRERRPMEFAVRGTHRETNTTMKRSRRALVG